MPSPAPDLERFVDAQAPVYARVCAELRAGRKQTHWIWFIFPQLRALGRSETARHFGLAHLDEAQRYARHPRLGPRLVSCTRLVLVVPGRSPTQILGPPDDLKLCSCLTLFEKAAPTELLFADALERLYAGRRDALTLDWLRDNPAPPGASIG